MAIQVFTDDIFEILISSATGVHQTPQKAFFDKFKNQNGHKSESNNDHDQQSIENEQKPLGFLVVKGQRHTVISDEAQNDQHHAHEGLIRRQTQIF